jgi:hypothetical protein
MTQIRNEGSADDSAPYAKTRRERLQPALQTFYTGFTKSANGFNSPLQTVATSRYWSDWNSWPGGRRGNYQGLSLSGEISADRAGGTQESNPESAAQLGLYGKINHRPGGRQKNLTLSGFCRETPQPFVLDLDFDLDVDLDVDMHR